MPTNNTDNIYSTEYEDSGTPIPSTKIGYDNTVSGLQATNVQGAIDEVAGDVTAVENGVTAINTTLTNKYLLMGDFTIVASNKTYTQVINPETGMLADINAMLSALEDDEYVVIESMIVPAFDTLFCPTYTMLSNQTTLDQLAFKLENVTTTAVLMVDIQMKTSPRAAQVVFNATPVVTFTDLESSATTQDFTVRYKKYKKV